MLLNEIFDTKADVTWKETPTKLLGTFTVDNNLYQIDLNTDTIKLPSGIKTSVDTAFRKNDSGKLSCDNIPFKIIGPILWAMNQKIKEIKPDVITFAVLTADGNAGGRMTLYEKLGFLMSKSVNYDPPVEWIDIKVGKMTFIPSKSLTTEDIEDMKQYIKNIVDPLHPSSLPRKHPN